MTGFAPSRPAATSRRLWFSLYSRDDQDQPLDVLRLDVACQPGQDLARQAVITARDILRRSHVAYEVIAHRGPSKVPAAGDDVLARVCREPFRHSQRLG